MKTFLIEAGGFSWNLREWGAGNKETLLFLHGFTWTSEAWTSIAEALSERFHCLAVDLPGHGETLWPDDPELLDFDEVVRSLLDLVAKLKHGSLGLGGYSLGGRLALRLATMAPGSFDRLVLIGASAGLATETERRERRQSDAAMAERLEREGLEAFITYWSNLPLFAGMRRLSAEDRARYRAARLQQDPKGLAMSLRVLGLGSQPDLLDRLAGLEVPTLLVVGEEDHKFRAIAQQMLERLPKARVETVPRVGHAVPLERPEELIMRLNAFT